MNTKYKIEKGTRFESVVKDETGKIVFRGFGSLGRGREKCEEWIKLQSRISTIQAKLYGAKSN